MKEAAYIRGKIHKMAEDLEVSFDIAAKAASELIKQGLSTKKMLSRLRDSIILAKKIKLV